MATAENGKARIFYEVSGTGPPIILGHSFLCSGRMWAHQVEALSNVFRTITVDLRGHGRSANVREPFSLYDAVDDNIAVLDQLGIERAVWAGLSIGGMIALRAALTAPDRVSALILMDTDAGAEILWKKLKYRALGVGARALGVRPFLPAIVSLMFGRSTRSSQPALVDEWTSEFSAVDVPSMLHALGALVRRDSLLHRLDAIGVPALVIVGDEDSSLPPELSTRIAAQLPASSLVVVPECGHLSALEQPEAVTAAMLGFLKQLGDP